MPKMISTWQFKSRIEDVDLARIFAEAPCGANVLRIIIGDKRLLAIRMSVYDKACEAKIPKPVTSDGVSWWPDFGAGITGHGWLPYAVPSGHRTGWIFSVAVLADEHEGVRVHAVLDWLARADAWQKAQTKVIVEAY